ncbi:MAG: CsbD family protein [Chloroflexi bacterium]|nr:CsbD family protein [Chloroflexota bacterium]
MAGRKDEIVGGVKKGLGKLTGDRALEAEGTAQQAHGEAERKMSGAAQEVKGNIKKAAGSVLGSPTLKAEGEADKIAGRVERA